MRRPNSMSNNIHLSHEQVLNPTVETKLNGRSGCFDFFTAPPRAVASQKSGAVTPLSLFLMTHSYVDTIAVHTVPILPSLHTRQLLGLECEIVDEMVTLSKRGEAHLILTLQAMVERAAKRRQQGLR